MPDVHIRIEVDADSEGNLGKAIACLQKSDPDFLWPIRPWWHKPPNNPRGFIARRLSWYGLRGRLSVEEHDGVSAWDAEPRPRWTGFVPTTNPKKVRR